MLIKVTKERIAFFVRGGPNVNLVRVSAGREENEPKTSFCLKSNKYFVINWNAMLIIFRCNILEIGPPIQISPTKFKS